MPMQSSQPESAGSLGDVKMSSLRKWGQSVSLGLCLGLSALAAQAGGTSAGTPVVYTLQTVADGRLGTRVFSEALVTFVMRSDTAHVTQNGTRFENRYGPVQVSVTANGRTTVAHFQPGQVWVYYDTGLGIAGFASSISPSYPVSLDCNDNVDPSTYTVDCAQGDNSADNGTLGALVAGATYTTPPVLLLPQSLTQSTLLTGRAHTCATLYTFDQYSDMLACGGAAPKALLTDHGGLYLQDMVGGSNLYGDGPFNYNGWDVSNSGYLHVEVAGQ